MPYTEVVQYSGSSVLTDVEVQVLSRAERKPGAFWCPAFFFARDGEDLKRMAGVPQHEVRGTLRDGASWRAQSGRMPD